MGQQLPVTPLVLQTGSQDVAGLQQTCRAIAEDVVSSLTSMAGAAGHPGLSSALTGAAGHGSHAYTTMWAAYGHASQGLAGSAQVYFSADDTVASKAKGIPFGLFSWGPQQP